MKGDIHSFNTSLAERFGIEEAILIRNLSYWVTYNEQAGEHFYDGRTWVYFSLNTLASVFPYMSKSAIDRKMRHLVDEGFLLVGNYNKVKFDRTRWYAFSDGAYAEIFTEANDAFPKMGNDISQNGKSDIPKRDNNTNRKSNIKNNIKDSTSCEVLTPSEPEEEEKRPSPKEVVELFKSICKSYPKPKSMSEARAKAIKARQKQYTDDEFREMFEKAEASAFLKGANDRNWSATFDWLMCDRNFGRVIDGNYDNGKVGYNPKKGAKETDDEWMQRMLREFADEDEKEEETEVLPY